MQIVDAHLDLAYNAVRGRDLTRPAAQQPRDDEGTPSVGFPDLRAGGAALLCGTIFCEPALRDGAKGYRTSDEARAVAIQQLHWYQAQAQAGHFRIIADPAHLPPAAISASPAVASDSPIPLIILMEGADPIRSPEDVREWFEAGVRIVGLAWKRTRYAGGTGAPGPLSAEGVDLVRELDRFGIIHDVSHIAEQAFWQLLDTSSGPIIASHSNCRTIIPTDRHLSDEMARALMSRGAVIGVNLFDKFLIPPIEYGQRRATLTDVVNQIRHLCDLSGSSAHIGLGTDLDGGFGAEHLPSEIRTWADLPLLAEMLSHAGFVDADIRRIMAGNWLRFFSRALPASPRTR